MTLRLTLVHVALESRSGGLLAIWRCLKDFGDVRVTAKAAKRTATPHAAQRRIDLRLCGIRDAATSPGSLRFDLRPFGWGLRRRRPAVWPERLTSRNRLCMRQLLVRWIEGSKSKPAVPKAPHRALALLRRAGPALLVCTRAIALARSESLRPQRGLDCKQAGSWVRCCSVSSGASFSSP